MGHICVCACACERVYVRVSTCTQLSENAMGKYSMAFTLWVGLPYLIVVIPDHTHLLLREDLC